MCRCFHCLAVCFQYHKTIRGSLTKDQMILASVTCPCEDLILSGDLHCNEKTKVQSNRSGFRFGLRALGLRMDSSLESYMPRPYTTTSWSLREGDDGSAVLQRKPIA